MAFRGSAGQANSSTNANVVVTVSGIGGIGPQLNDIIFLFVDNGGGTTNTFTFPAGFNAIATLTNFGLSANGSTTSGIAYKIGTASEPSTYTVSSSVTDMFCCDCRVYSGRNTSSPFTNVARTLVAGGATCPLTTALTGVTSATGDDLIYFMGTGNGTWSATVTPGQTQQSGFGNSDVVFANTNFSPPLFAGDMTNVASGASGTLTPIITAGGAGNSNVDYGAFVISLAIGQTSAVVAWLT